MVAISLCYYNTEKPIMPLCLAYVSSHNACKINVKKNFLANSYYHLMDSTVRLPTKYHCKRSYWNN